jgi:hypothetical protein
MAITINYATYTINVPQSFLTPLGGILHQLDTNAFRIALRDLEDGEDGVVQPITHNHNTSVLLGGIQYARVIEMLSPYTITFEETGTPYIVSLSGSNNNILEKTNLGTVQVLSNNSAGLINVAEIQRAAYGECVWIDQANSTGKAVAGTAYPTGTKAKPCTNLTDAKTICVANGFDTIKLINDFTLGASDVLTEYHIHGEGATLNATRTKITFTSGNTTTGAHFYEARITGPQGGETNYHSCIIEGLGNAHCHYTDCGFLTPSTYAYTLQASNTISAGHITDLHDCYGDEGTAIIDRNGTRLNQRYINFSGNIKFINQNRADAGASNRSGDVWIHMSGGTLTIDASCTTGYFYVSGVCTVINNSTSTVNTSLVTAGADQVSVAGDPWIKVIESGLTAEEVFRIIVAALAGTSTKAGSTITFKGIDGTTDRIVGSFDAENNRTGAILDGS